MAGTEGFTQRLRAAMRRAGVVNEAELARRLETRQSTVSNWFKRGTPPDGRTLARLRDVLGVSLDWLLCGVGPPEPVDADAYEAGARAAIAPLRRALDEAQTLIEEVAESRFVPVPRPPPKPPKG